MTSKLQPITIEALTNVTGGRSAPIKGPNGQWSNNVIVRGIEFPPRLRPLRKL